ncbi:MAG: hypothetical protein HY046_01095 [Acidobacteria bacterium]|nr:hypothetical protein [Acidobacteriota bacterium]
MRWFDFRTGARQGRIFSTIFVASAIFISLTLAGCGGGGTSGSSSSIIITVSPSATIAQLNQTVQFGAVVSGAPLINIATSNGAVRTSNVVTITTTAAHGFSVGQTVTIAGVTDTSFSGSFVIVSVPTTTTFTFAQTGVDAASGQGTIPQNAVKWQVNGTEGGSASVGTITASGLYTAPAVLVPVTTATITATGAVRASNIVTITTTAAHAFQAGQIISITGVTDPAQVLLTIPASGAVRKSNTTTITTSTAHGFAAGQVVTIAGVNDPSFNGAFAIATVPSTTTFTISQTAADSTSGGGTASVAVITFNGTFAINTVPSTTTFTYTQAGPNVTTGSGTVTSAAVQIKAVSVSDANATATASVVLDSGISLALAPAVVTLAPGDIVQFVATNSGPTTTNLNWLVNDVAGGNTTFGTISATGLYMAPATVPVPASVTVKAQATADNSKTITAVVTVTALVTPTLTSLFPTLVAQGSGFQDFYLVGSNFLTSSVVRFNGVIVPNTPTAVSPTLLRVRVPDTFFSAAGTFPVDIAAQSGGASAALNVTITPQRPALIGTAPNSVVQGSPTATVNFNGGYFSPAVSAFFNGGIRAATIASAQQLGVTLSAGDLSSPGLFAVGVQNPTATQTLAEVNLAIQPTAAASTVTTVATGGTTPSSVAINTTTGIAVVANKGSGTISRIDLNTNSLVGAPIQVGGSATSSPTGVSVDNIRNLAVVANNGTNSISFVDLAAGTVTSTIPSPTLPGFGTPLKPISVGVNPLTGLALVANASTNTATILDLNTRTVLGTAVNVSTGANPEVAVDPRLNWGVITPGGAGALTIVDLGRQTAITAAGAVRASTTDVVTITLAQTHGISVGDTVTISGVTDISFNGTFVVTTVPTTTSFTYSQLPPSPTPPLPGASSGGGVCAHPGVLASFTLGLNVRGISISPETHTAFLADPTSPNPVVISLLDQTVNSLPATTGFAATAVSPLTNVGVMANFGTSTIQLVDLRQPIAIGSPLAVGSGPRAVAIDPGSNTAVVANETSNDVTIVNLGAIRSPHILQSSPMVTISSGGGLALDIVGFGLSAATVRLDGTAIPTTVLSPRHVTATVPAALMASARRFAVDVQTAGGVSNVTSLTVIQPVAVGTAPAAVAIDPDRDLAIVANSGSNNISVVNLNTGTVSQTIAVGTSPQGVGVISRLGRAVVSNFGSNNASLVDLVAGTVSSTVTVGSGPLGVAIDPDSANAIVANSTANTVSVFPSDIGGTPTTITVEQRPTAIAIDAVRGRAAVAHTTQNSVVFVAITGGATAGRATGFQVPSGIVYDPVRDKYIVASSLLNNLALLDPVSFQSQSVRVGINPTSIAYNRHSSTVVTVNTASNTMSVLDYNSLQVEDVFSIMAAPLFAVEIHPRTNIAVVVDQANNRILLVPLPH